VPKLLKVLGILLLAFGGLWLIMIPFAALDAEHRDAVPGLIFIGLFFGVPGGLMLRSGTQRQREHELQEQMVGFVRTHDAFSLDELAAHIGVPPARAQTLLNRDIARYRLPLVMHRASGRYLRLDRLSRAARVAERCHSCGGSLGTQIVFEGEQLTCPYCGVVVQTHAPAQASWNQAQGAWGQQPWAPQQPPQPQYQPHQHYQPHYGAPNQQQQQHYGGQHQGGPWGQQ
jgi:hypothetical protein